MLPRSEPGKLDVSRLPSPVSRLHPPLPLHCWSSAAYAIPLPDGHRFPMAKYALLREGVLTAGLLPPERLHSPSRVVHDDLLRVHTAAYIDHVTNGTLSPLEQRRIGLPWSPAFVERAWRVVRGTVEAAEAALEHGVAMNLAGGTHHAFPDRGEGFCTFNDVAVAVRRLQHHGRIRRAVIIDLDVHQGNGTHACFAGDPSVYTFSMHGAKNFPFHKVAGTLDVDLDDGTGDEVYLETLATHLPRVLHSARADLVVYLAGADPHENDRLGRLNLTFDGLRRRDAMVLQACRDIGLPVCITIAGGYGRDVRETVAVHLGTVAVATTFTLAI
ncbi:MAG: histone deacetylase [Gemmatimonadaceae bacterium]|nr:histone deacetylase [Gemmatimonadaceae bacterium]